MPDDVVPDVSAESSAASDAASSTPAGALNAETPEGGKQQPSQFVPYKRFAEVTGQLRQFRDAHSQLTQHAQGLERRIAELEAVRRPGEQVGPEEQQAIQALKRLHSLDPDLRGTADLPKLTQRLEKLEAALTQLVTGQRDGWASSGRKSIAEFVGKTGLGTEAAGKLEKAVLGYIVDDPQLYQRFSRGDVSVVTEALEDIEKHLLGGVRREAAAGVAVTKNKVRSLPPAPRGTAAGEAAPRKLEPGKEREFLEGTFDRFRQKMREMTAG